MNMGREATPALLPMSGGREAKSLPCGLSVSACFKTQEEDREGASRELPRFASKEGGDYTRKVVYEWVGDGDGDFEIEEPQRPNEGCRTSVKLSCVFCLVGLMAVAVVHSFCWGASPSHRSAGSVAASPSASPDIPLPELNHTQLPELNESRCELLWNLTLGEMVAAGWGSRMLYAAIVYQSFDLWVAECDFITSESIAAEWNSSGLKAPGRTMPQQQWSAIDTSDLHVLDARIKASIRGTWPGQQEELQDWTKTPTSTELVYMGFAACMPAFDDTLKSIFSNLLRKPGPIAGSYVGLHVGPGEDSNESAISSFQTTLALARTHSNLTAVRLSTDDADVIASALQLKDAGTDITWAHAQNKSGREAAISARSHRDARRSHRDAQVGAAVAQELGELQEAVMDLQKDLEDSDEREEAAVAAVISDTSALAHATVLVGNFKSQFFKLVWMLNWLRRTDEERAEDWCYDVMTGLSCSSRHAFVVQYADSAREKGVPEWTLPADIQTLQSCGTHLLG